MKKFVKKLEIFEAERWWWGKTSENENYADWPIRKYVPDVEGLVCEVCKYKMEDHGVFNDKKLIHPGNDWIVKTYDGKFLFFKKEIFELMFEEVK
jgi:hypothetical protein